MIRNIIRDYPRPSVALQKSGRQPHSGFTLLEMIVSFGIFSVVMITAVGAVLSINRAQIKAANIQSIQDNLRFALESMTKEMRIGQGFSPTQAVAGVPSAYEELNFTVPRVGGGFDTIGYCFQDGLIKKLSGTADCSLGSAVTGDDVVIEELTFYVIGELPGDATAPRITVSIRAHAANLTLATSFRLQTTVTPRERGQ